MGGSPLFERGQRKRVRLVQAERTVMVSEVTILYNHGEYKIIIEYILNFEVDGLQ